MATTHDGLVHPLPSTSRQVVAGIALVALLGAAGWGVVQGMWIVVAVGVVGALCAAPMLMGSQRRIRVTHSKLLIEDEHPVVNILIGPMRHRVTYEEIEEVGTEGGLKVKTPSGVQSFAESEPADDIKRLATKLKIAMEAHEKGI